MMEHQLHDGSTCMLGVDALRQVEQERLVVVLTSGGLGEESLLNREGQHLAMRPPLVAHDRDAPARRQLPQDRRLEDVAHTDRDPDTRESGHQLDGGDRVSSRAEEVGVPPHACDAQHLRPHLGEPSLVRCLRRLVVADRERRRIRERPDVELARRGQRERFHRRDRRRHHVLREA